MPRFQESGLGHTEQLMFEDAGRSLSCLKRIKAAQSEITSDKFDVDPLRGAGKYEVCSGFNVTRSG